MRYLADHACPECPWGSRIVEDHTNGDYVCTGCGLVTGRVFVDVEWRNFAEEVEDKSRVGQVYDELLEGVGGGVRTAVGGDGAEAKRMRNLHARLQDGREARLLRDFAEVQRCGDLLGMGADCVKAAKDLFKRCLEVNANLREDTRRAAIAVSLFYGGRIDTHVGVGRTIPEVMAACGTTTKPFNKAKEILLSAVKDTSIWKKVATVTSKRQDALVRKVNALDTGKVPMWNVVRAARSVDDFCRDNGVGQCQHQDMFMTSVIFVACGLLKVPYTKKAFTKEMGITPSLLNKNESMILDAFEAHGFRLRV